MEPQIAGNEEPKTEKKADVVLSLEELIRNHSQNIEKLKEEKKKKAEMLKDSYMSDSVYKDLDDKAKTARKTAGALKSQILKIPGNVKLNQEVKDLQSDIKESQEALSEYLVEYKRITGASQLELFPGEFGEIVLSAKIVKQPKFN